MRQETLAVLLIDALDAVDLEHVDSNSVNHGAARASMGLRPLWIDAMGF
jgi:hypothetical protein